MFDREPKKSLASQMQHYVVIQTKVSTTDGEGGFSENWSTDATVAAAVLPIQARQQFAYKSINVEATHLIKVRAEVAVTELNRIRWGSRVFEILTVEDIQERGVVKIITCLEKR